MLTLDVEFLLGVCFAARSPSDPEPDWPPQPDRLFSALVATWAARGEQEEEKRALEWLEKLDPPAVRASVASARTAPTVFVPPNDAKGTQIHALPDRRKRQERRFPAAIPENRVVSYAWTRVHADAEVLECLQALARDTSYVGHSSSLVRCYFHHAPDEIDSDPGTMSRLRVYPGRLAELLTGFKEGRRRRPAPGESTRAPAVAPTSIQQSVLGGDWLVFGDAGGHCPDLRRAAVAARAFRTAILSGFNGDTVPEVISGHAKDGRPSGTPHMAILPLANVGWKWADGCLKGLAVCLPRQAELKDRQRLFQALATIIRARGAEEHSELEVDLPGTEPWRLVMQPEPYVSSLKPFRYLRSATTWATATPIALDRHPKEKGNEALQIEIAGLVAEACTRIGLPAPVAVVPDKHPAIRGSEPAIPSPKSPPWMRWALPGALQGRVLTHATLVFDQPVQGPIVLGAGRFLGLGLCLPLDQESRT